MFINATPHALSIIRENGSVLTVPKSSLLVRVSTSMEQDALYEGVEMFRCVYGNVELILDGQPVQSLPPFLAGSVVIVSGMALEAIKRQGITGNFASPGELIRSPEGQPIGCKGLKI